METVFSDPQYQNELDAEMIYNTIEEEIVPKYYDRDADGIPRAWMASVKKCIAEIASNFTTNRMLRDYEVRFYNRLAARKRELSENDFAVAREIVAWKHKVLAAWPAVKIVDVQRARVGDKPDLHRTQLPFRAYARPWPDSLRRTWGPNWSWPVPWSRTGSWRSSVPCRSARCRFRAAR